VQRRTRRRIGITQIAELANVSIGTVDRALHARPGINETTRKRILQIANQMGYTPNLAARALSTARAKMRIGVCIPRELHFFYDELWEGIYTEAEYYRDLGIEFLYRPVPELGKGEAKEVARILDSGVQGMILVPGRPQETGALIDKAEGDNVRVVCVSTDAPETKRSSIVCVDPRLHGMIAGELMAKFVRPAAQAAIITGMLVTENHAHKAEGFEKSFLAKCPGGQVVGILEAHEDEDESFQRTYELLGNFPDLDGIYVNTVNCLPVCRALAARKVSGKVKLIATDLFREMVPLLEENVICASIHQRPYRQGRVAVATLAEHLAAGRPLRTTNYLNPGIVLHSNLHLFQDFSRAHNSRVLHPVSADC